MLTTISPAKRPAGVQATVGAVHRDVASLAQVAQRHAGAFQRRLERETAADQEADQVGAPQRGDVGALLDELAVAVDAVAGGVGGDVGAGRAQRLARAGRQHLDQRAAACGLRWQNSRKSNASACGRIARLACARPARGRPSDDRNRPRGRRGAMRRGRRGGRAWTHSGKLAAAARASANYFSEIIEFSCAMPARPAGLPRRRRRRR